MTSRSSSLANRRKGNVRDKREFYISETIKTKIIIKIKTLYYIESEAASREDRLV